MERVAEALTIQAISVKDERDANLFGRSAFNRYYYSVYLSTRQMVRIGHPEIKQFKHKELPDLLIGKVQERIQQEASKLKKRNILSDGQASQLVQSARQALSELANILREGYHIRVIADYEPTVIATVSNGHVILESKTSDAARQWGLRAQRCIGQIHRVWRQLGIST
ncbi:hypothetical protein [Burkholderia sp. Ax-1724]|uniref:hypothetical protein n=1 Tax=Burkholderia sp. Ax-1724 TaxID=2608336 RepID=UPI0014215523|nr:hypothetical protein [Burkholderia sp. Ax-1724]NIF53504.1 hypothetical protein [Burkholderia sp. Ax-1724]